ncbi:hypothetical protein Poly51_15230 [Rubripirellula tenax]|uniref:Uncharacterized protein n=1 Tax=Rubripirellula tenax TaxID=2528015 RepID=A0A5C6FAE5_9BACT|nr:hypothetical protein Poly51_15230 [Rubripirellula tenax]
MPTRTCLVVSKNGQGKVPPAFNEQKMSCFTSYQCRRFLQLRPQANLRPKGADTHFSLARLTTALGILLSFKNCSFKRVRSRIEVVFLCKNGCNSIRVTL